MYETEIAITLADKLATHILAIWNQCKYRNNILEHIHYITNSQTQTIHLLINEHIFIPLRNCMIQSIESYHILPILSFDPLNVRHSDYYEDAIQHLEKDIQNFVLGLKTLRTK